MITYTQALTRAVTQRVTQPIGDGWRRGAAFNPASLFAGGEQGAWYDPSDFSTLFQGSAGTTPVTAVGQPVGLMLDRRFGLVRGAELVSNGDFSQGTAGWTDPIGGVSTLSVAAGVATLAGNGASYPRRTHNTTCVPGVAYEILVDVLSTGPSGAFLLFDISGNGAIRASRSGAGQMRAIVIATATTMKVSWGVNTATLQDVSVSRVSVRELPGNHASQATSGMRPVLKDTSGVYWLDYDGVDDKLTTVFPDLGTDVTIARAVVGVGASILTSQTIGAGNWDDSTDSAELIIVNRSLTGSETVGLTAYLNTVAGV